jgi:hypothetical protein
MAPSHIDDAHKMIKPSVTAIGERVSWWDMACSGAQCMGEQNMQNLNLSR